MEGEKEITKELYKALKELGLTDLETRLYAISLKLGPSTVTDLAKYLKISRPNVYKVINGLKGKGLAAFYGQDKYGRNFMVESPMMVLSQLRVKREQLSRLDVDLASDLPDLLALYQQGGKDTKIKIIKDKEGYIKIFRQTLEETPDGGSVEFFGSAGEFIGFVSWDEEKRWIKSRIKRQITVKTLILPDQYAATLRVDQNKELREVRLYSGEANFPTSYLVYGNKMILWQPKAPLAVLIEDEYIVAMFRSVFYSLWEKSK